LLGEARVERTVGRVVASVPFLHRAAAMQTLFVDVKHALRSFWQSPGYTAAAMLALALGIGVNVAVFSLLHAALIAALPIRDPQSLVQVFTWSKASGDHFDFSYPLYVDLRDRASSLEGLAAYTTGSVGLAAGDRSERVFAEFVTSNYFPLLGVPVIGPGLSGADELRGGAKVVVVSETLARRMFGDDISIVGRTLTLNGQPFTIVGISPQRFTGIVRGQHADLWISIAQFFPLRNRPDLLDQRESSWMSLIGRVAAGVSVEQAQDQLTSVVQNLGVINTSPDEEARVRVAGSGDIGLVEGLESPLRLLMAAVTFILLIACANVANLLLARTSVRQQELALRRALGATRLRIARQVLTETFVLAVGGSVIGVLLAMWVVDVFQVRPFAGAAPLDLDTALGAPILLFATALAIAATLLAGIIPAIGLGKGDFIDSIRGAGAAIGGRPGPRRMRSALAVVQVALSLVLVIGATLFARSLAQLKAVEPSLVTDRVLATAVNLTLRGYDEPRGRQFYDALLARMKTQPAIETAVLSSVLPVTFGGTRINLKPHATQPPIDAPFEADIITTSPGYFATFAVPLIAGRDFSPADSQTAPRVTVINETMSRTLWGTRNPVGDRLSLGSVENAYEVIGVARDTKYRGLRESSRMTMYLPLAQSYAQVMNLAVRTSGATGRAADVLGAEMHALDPGLPLYNVRTLAEHVESSLYIDATRSRLVTTLALLASALAVIGVYGLLSFIVSERTREVGLRLALGAKPTTVLRMVLGTGVRLAGWGVALGLVLALWLTRLIASDLYGVTTTDPLALMSASAGLFVLVLVATLMPALRVVRLDPVTALRQN
jgi:predicted permease